MNVSITLSSGEQDNWEDVADVVEDHASLVVLGNILLDEVPEGVKMMGIRSQIDNGPDLPPGEKVESFAICAIYAPGMWMKVEFV